MLTRLRYFLIFFCITFATSTFAEEGSRPRIGLVLSGGGAKGGAHIGVLKVLDEMQIPIDLVVGTSMGAVVGGLYATGFSGEQIEVLLTNLDWSKILRNILDRDYIYYRRKRDDDIFLLDKFIGLRDGQLRLPTGVVQGHKLYQSFKNIILPKEPIKNFDNLRIPYRAVATDLETGNPVVLRSGDLAQAMYASMAVPGLFTPVAVDDILLVDGGVSSNVPVEIAQSMGVDLLIVVDVGAKLLTRDQITGFQSVLTQLSNIQVLENADRSLKHLSAQDILIQPNVDDMATEDFEKIQVAIDAGVLAANKNAFRLEAYASSFSGPAYEIQDEIYIKQVHVRNQTMLCDQIFHEYLPKPPGTFSTRTIDDAISRLYGLELFENIYYTMDQDVFVIKPVERSWGPNYVQGTLQLSTDFEGDSSFRFGLGITRTLRNSLAGEMRIFGSIGFATGLFAEWYQPLTPNLAWYITPKIAYFRENLPVFTTEVERIRYLNSQTSGTLAFGRNFGEWGRAEVGYQKIAGALRIKVGPITATEWNYKDAHIYARLEWDTLDNSFFPDKGARGQVQYADFRENLGSDNDFEQVTVSNLLAYTIGRHTLDLYGRYDTTISNKSSLGAQFRVGGLFRLSGLLENQLLGQEAALFNLVYFYRFKELNIIPNYPFPMYLGCSFELGNAWESKRSLLKHSFRKGGSIFLGVDTIIGPFYLGYGFTENGQRAAHLYMGRLF